MSIFGELFGFEIVSSDDVAMMHNAAQNQLALQQRSIRGDPGNPYLWGLGLQGYVRPWSEDERERRLKQFDLDRASFRRLPTSPYIETKEN